VAVFLIKPPCSPPSSPNFNAFTACPVGFEKFGVLSRARCFCASGGFSILFLENFMTTPTLPAGLEAPIEILAHCLALTNENYQRLLNQPESLSFCRDAGRSLRVLSDRVAQVMVAALSYSPEFDDDDAGTDDKEDAFFEEDNDD
jgi:hypothetical protein